MAIHGYTWQYIAVHSHTWQYMAIHSSTWLYIAIQGRTITKVIEGRRGGGILEPHEMPAWCEVHAAFVVFSDTLYKYDVSCRVNCKEIISSYTLKFPRLAQDFERSAHGTCFDLFWKEKPHFINHRIHYQTRFDNNHSALSQTMRTVCQPITACSQGLGNPTGRWNTISDGVTQTSLFCVQQRK